MKSWKRGLGVTLMTFVCASLARPAHATFHLTEITQVIGGVNGDTNAQAIQLKMRTTSQNFLNGAARLVVHDSAGLNPVVLTAFPPPNPVSGACRSILIATPGFANVTSPPVDAAARDYEMAGIPTAYLAAGSLTFEDATGANVWWRLSWGGYTGPGTVVSTGDFGNDNDGNANPPFAGALPSTSTQALNYTPGCPTVSTTSASQYSLTGGAAVFTNNDSANFTVTPPAPAPMLPGWSSWGLAILLAASGAWLAARRKRPRA